MSTTISAPSVTQWGADSGELYASAIELRLLSAHEAYLVHQLAVLDEAADLDGQILLAVIGGQGVAALSLNDQRVVANPFAPTTEAVALLRLRATQLSTGHRRPPLFRRALRARVRRPS